MTLEEYASKLMLKAVKLGTATGRMPVCMVWSSGVDGAFEFSFGFEIVYCPVKMFTSVTQDFQIISSKPDAEHVTKFTVPSDDTRIFGEHLLHYLPYHLEDLYNAFTFTTYETYLNGMLRNYSES